MVSLGDLEGGSDYSGASGLSSDGSVVVGQSDSSWGLEAFRWTSGAGMVSLGYFEDSYTVRALGVSADGSIIVGDSETASGGVAFIWDSMNGMRNLRTVLTSDYGLDLTDWTLNTASAISSDGLKIVGYGLHNGNTEAFYADLTPAAVPEPSSFALVAVAAGSAVWRRCRRKSSLPAGAERLKRSRNSA